MVGRERFELSTNGLKVHCSTAELTAPLQSITAVAQSATITTPLRRERVRGEAWDCGQITSKPPNDHSTRIGIRPARTPKFNGKIESTIAGRIGNSRACKSVGTQTTSVAMTTGLT